jgi:hypothetical protein
MIGMVDGARPGAGRTARRGTPTLALMALVLGMGLAGCTQATSQAAAGPKDAGCGDAAREFNTAAQFYIAPDRAGLTLGAYRTTLARAGDDGAKAAQLAADMQDDAAALDRVTDSYGALVACHTGHAASWRTAAAGGTLAPTVLGANLTAEGSIFRAEQAKARQVLGSASDLESVYAGAAAPLLAGHGVGLDPDRPYRALASTVIRSTAGAEGTSLAVLRKGQRVLGPGSADTPGWVAIDLDDGSLGYVDATMLKPLTPNASEQKAGVRLAANDRFAALGAATREILPQKRAALAAVLDTADVSAASAFAPSIVAATP